MTDNNGNDDGDRSELPLAVSVWSAIEHECLREESKGVYGMWGRYLRFTGMRYNPDTLKLTDVVFHVDGCNSYFGTLRNDIRFRVIEWELEKACDNIRTMFARACIDRSRMGLVYLKASGSFSKVFATTAQLSWRGEERIFEFKKVVFWPERNTECQP